MNLGQAVAVCLWELRRTEIEGTTPRVAGSKVLDKKQELTREKDESGIWQAERKKRAAEIRTVERITEVMLEVLRKSGYVAPRGHAIRQKRNCGGCCEGLTWTGPMPKCFWG